MPIPVGITQLLVWKDLLIALTSANEIWFLRGANAWPSGSQDVQSHTWVLLDSRVSPDPVATAGW
jgi:hypothetical protein